MLGLNLYQWMALIFGLVMIAKAWSHFLRKDKSLKELIAWHVVFGGMVILSLEPNLVEWFAYYTGFKSGINAIIFFCIAVLFYLVFRLVNVNEELERKFTKLVRELALKEKDNKD